MMNGKIHYFHDHFPVRKLFVYQFGISSQSSIKVLQLNPMLVHNLQQSLDRRGAGADVRGFRRRGRSWPRGEGQGAETKDVTWMGRLVGYANCKCGLFYVVYKKES